MRQVLPVAQVPPQQRIPVAPQGWQVPVTQVAPLLHPLPVAQQG